MTDSFIRNEDFPAFVAALIDVRPVYGPVAKRSRYAFERLEAPDELRLDYDVTILPPKKLFFPPEQDLVRFDESGYRAALEPTKKILFGVHFYDVKAIDQTDLLFSERNYDVNYMANRLDTTIVASNIQNVSAQSVLRECRRRRGAPGARRLPHEDRGRLRVRGADRPRQGAAAVRRVP